MRFNLETPFESERLIRGHFGGGVERQSRKR